MGTRIRVTKRRRPSPGTQHGTYFDSEEAVRLIRRCVHFLIDLSIDMWNIVLASLRLRPLQALKPPEVEETVANLESVEKMREKKKKSDLDKMNAYRRKRVLRNLKAPKEADNVTEGSEDKSTDSFDAEETWNGLHEGERNGFESGLESNFGPEVEGNSCLTPVVVEVTDVALPAPLESQESKPSSSSSPSSGRPSTRPGRSRRQKRNAKMRKATGARTDKGKKSGDAKKNAAAKGRDAENRPADDSEMPENDFGDHVEVVEDVTPSSYFPLVMSNYINADGDHLLYEDLRSCVVDDEDTLFHHGFPRQIESLDVLQFTDQQAPLKRERSNPSSHHTPAPVLKAQPFPALPLQNSTSASYDPKRADFSSTANIGCENINHGTLNGNWRDPSLASVSRPFWEGGKRCCRCGVYFTLSKTGTQMTFPTPVSCRYHWDNSGRNGYYKCCGTRVDEAPLGCWEEPFHVYQHVVVGVERLLYPYHGFITTAAKKRGKRKASRDVVSLDCEMVYTVAGMKLAQVVVLDVKGFVKYTTYVRPYETILSYNTEHSGVKKEDLVGPGVKTLPEVQQDLYKIITSNTIIIGHALHNDLKALKLLHNLVVDTQMLYGFTGIKKLACLSKTFLDLEIHNCYGHDCEEDARVALDLALRFVGDKRQGSKENFKTM